MIATLTPSPCIDLSVLVDDLVTDDANRVRAFRKYPGGKGVCVSRVLKRLGGDPLTVTLLGGPAGREVRDYLEKEDLRLWVVDLHEETRTNVIVYEKEYQSATRLHMPGPHVRENEVDELNGLIRGLPDSVAYLALGGTLLPGFSEDFYPSVIRQMRKREIRVVFDSDAREFGAGLRESPFMIKPNHFELGRLTGKPTNTVREVYAAAREINRQGIELVVVSMGRDGAVAVTKDRAVRATAPPVETRSTVGSGDSMVAGILHCLNQGKTDLAEILAMGTACGTATALTPGTELCYPEDIERLLREVRTEEIGD